MKNTLILIYIIFLTNSFAIDDIFKNSILKQERTSYEKGIILYKKKEFKKAYEIFNKLFITNLDNIFINYYLGRSAYELKLYEFAVSAYDRILMQEPQNNKVRLELAQTYLSMGLWAQSLDEFIKVSEGKLPKQLKQRVEKTIALLKNKQRKSIFSFYSLFAMIYDSNINNSSDIGAFDIYSPNLSTNITVNNSTKKESAMIYQVVGSFNYKYKIEDKLIWDNNLSSINLKYDDHKDKDINIISLNSGPMYYTKNYKTTLIFTFDKLYLGQKDYQSNFYIRPEYTTSLTEKSMYLCGIKIGRVNYDNNSDLDAKIFEVTNTFRYISDNYGLFSFRTNVGKEIEVNKIRTDVSYNYFDFFLANSISVFDEYTFITTAGYKVSRFNDYDENFKLKRRDKKRDFSVAIEKQIANNTVVNIGTTYTKRNSNQEPSVYSKYILKVSFYMTF